MMIVLIFLLILLYLKMYLLHFISYFYQIPSSILITKTEANVSPSNFQKNKGKLMDFHKNLRKGGSQALRLATGVMLEIHLFVDENM